MATETGIPVDSENKAKKLKLLSVARPHMRAFHLSWFAFFVCFTSTFAAPPLLPIIRDNLDLTKKDVANAGIASVTGSVVSRLAMGALCDIVGPRYATASLIMLTAPAVFCMSLVTSATGFILVRFFIGFSLATFVSTQFWMSSMFSSSTVGFANGLAGGWGNAGGGATQLLMPLLYDLIHRIIGCTPFTAWRLAFFIPGTFHILMGIVVLVLTQDLPDGNYKQLTQRGDKLADSFTEVVRAGVGNYRTWILGITYGYCFGVELTVDNVIAQYFYDRFSLNLGTAGIVAASFGLANVFSRPGGGVLSDFVSRKFGMRGRIWALWIFQTVGGLLCVALGKSDSLVVAIIVMVTFSVFVQSACGLTFGIVPFVSRRALGIVSGMTGAGGNVGAIVTQLMFFTSSAYSEEQGITYMGFMMLACTVPVALLYFPQWGGMFCPASDKWKEENYYESEWSVTERQQGLCKNALKFAENSRLERGQKKKLTVSLPITNTINV